MTRSSHRLHIPRDKRSDPFHDGFLSIVRPAEQRGRPIPPQGYVKEERPNPVKDVKKVGSQLAELIRKSDKQQRYFGILWAKYKLECLRLGIRPEDLHPKEDPA